MGIECFFTFVDRNLYSPVIHSKTVNLTGSNVIIDGNSFVYFLSNQVNKYLLENETTIIKSTNDLYYRRFLYALKQFQRNCATVHVVFDGIFKRNKHKRERSIKASNSQISLSTSLIYEEFLCVLHCLKIPIRVAHGEGDSLVVEMARQNDAYIVADDSDYHLYEFHRGFVPLHYFSLETFNGRLYHMTNIFPGMNQMGVALWGTTMAFDYIELDKLKVRFVVYPENLTLFVIGFFVNSCF